LLRVCRGRQHSRARFQLLPNKSIRNNDIRKATAAAPVNAHLFCAFRDRLRSRLPAIEVAWEFRLRLAS